MPNTALNRTGVALLTNKSGGALTYGAVVVLDNTNANGFTTTTTSGLSTRGLGVILEPNGIANNASGLVAVGNYAPQVNLNTAATVGQFLKTHTVAGQATPHSSPQVEGDFGVALSASASPAALLFGSANGPLAGIASGGPLGTPSSGTLTNCLGALSTLFYLQYRDEKAQNTAGGTFTSGSWQTRTLNTEVLDAGGLGTLASNQITLAAGTYYVVASAPAGSVNRHQARLQNATDATTVIVGTAEYAANAGPSNRSCLSGTFTIGASKALELQHQCQTTKASDGFGVEANFTTEVYAVIEFWKIS